LVDYAGKQRIDNHIPLLACHQHGRLSGGTLDDGIIDGRMHIVSSTYTAP
jgi:hypothetical protein